MCKGVHCVDLGESFQTHIYLQNLASIQPRTSPVKFARPSLQFRKGAPVEKMQVRGRRLALVVTSISSPLWRTKSWRATRTYPSKLAIRCKICKIWRARSRLYQNEILQENMRLTAFFNLYKICILLHRCNFKIFAKICLKNQQFFLVFVLKKSAKFCKCRKICKILPFFEIFSCIVW